MRKKRDTCAKRLYAAESVSVDLDPGREFQDIVECQRFAHLVQSLDPLLMHLPWVSVVAAHGNKQHSEADFEENTISLARTEFNEQTLLHELAHIATGAGFSYHGPEFCWNYLDLTLRWRGVGVYIGLRDAIREQGIL